MGSKYANGWMPSSEVAVPDFVLKTGTPCSKLDSPWKSGHILPQLKTRHWLPTALRIKSLLLTTAHKALHNLLPACLSHLLSSHSPPYSSPDTLYLQHTKHTPASGALHMLYSLPGMLFPGSSHNGFLQLQNHLP